MDLLGSNLWGEIAISYSYEDDGQTFHLLRHATTMCFCVSCYSSHRLAKGANLQFLRHPSSGLGPKSPTESLMIESLTSGMSIYYQPIYHVSNFRSLVTFILTLMLNFRFFTARRILNGTV
jgi:hypothetical protein